MIQALLICLFFVCCGLNSVVSASDVKSLRVASRNLRIMETESGKADSEGDIYYDAMPDFEHLKNSDDQGMNQHSGSVPNADSRVDVEYKNSPEPVQHANPDDVADPVRGSDPVQNAKPMGYDAEPVSDDAESFDDDGRTYGLFPKSLRKFISKVGSGLKRGAAVFKGGAAVMKRGAAAVQRGGAAIKSGFKGLLAWFYGLRFMNNKNKEHNVFPITFMGVLRGMKQFFGDLIHYYSGPQRGPGNIDSSEASLDDTMKFSVQPESDDRILKAGY